jgi:hypothetical protein
MAYGGFHRIDNRPIGRFPDSSMGHRLAVVDQLPAALDVSTHIWRVAVGKKLSYRSLTTE